MPDTRSTALRVPVVPDFDAVLHQRVRLGIVSALAAGGALSHNDLKAALDLTDGNLSVHARKLEDAGYVVCHKSFDDRMPRTEYELTTAGHAALATYIDKMERLVTQVKGD